MRQTLFVVLIFFCLVVWGQQEKELSGKRVMMVVAKKGFRDEELREPKMVFERKGARVDVVSSATGVCTGMLGAKVKADMDIKTALKKVKEYDAVIFVGGVGAKQYFDDEVAHKVAQTAFKRGAIVGAICLAPVILARAGLLKGKKATVWKSAAEELKKCGAEYTANPVEKVGRIVTGNGPKAAAQFAQTIVEALKRLHLRGKKIAVILNDGFKDELLESVIRVLDESGAEVLLCGKRSGWVKSSSGKRVKVKSVSKRVDGVVFLGGVGVKIKDKVCAYVGAAVGDALKAGLLKGKTIIAWTNAEKYGAKTVEGQKCVRDKKGITCTEDGVDELPMKLAEAMKERK